MQVIGFTQGERDIALDRWRQAHLHGVHQHTVDVHLDRIGLYRQRDRRVRRRVGKMGCAYIGLHGLDDGNVVPHVFLELEVHLVQKRIVANLQNKLIVAGPSCAPSTTNRGEERLQERHATGVHGEGPRTTNAKRRCSHVVTLEIKQMDRVRWACNC